MSDYLKLGMETYALEDVWLKTQNKAHLRHAHTIEYNKQFRVGTFLIVPFPVAHTNSDGSDCPNAGFLIYSTVTKEKMLFITDAGYIESRFPPVDYIMIECNHVDVEDYKDELEYVNAFVESRRVKSHLSLDRCVDFLKNQDLSKVQWVRLLHLTESQGNIYNIILDRMNKEFNNIKFII